MKGKDMAVVSNRKDKSGYEIKIKLADEIKVANYESIFDADTTLTLLGYQLKHII